MLKSEHSKYAREALVSVAKTGCIQGINETNINKLFLYESTEISN